MEVREERIRQRTIVTQVMEQIRKMIASGEYKTGDKLPTEQQLAEQFDIGRSSIREAIKIFNYLGILESRTARGTYICDRTSISTEALTWSVLLGTRELRELIEVRAALELWSIQTLTAAVSEKKAEALRALEKLQSLVDQMRKAGNAPREETRIDADYEFHQTIINAGNNTIFSAIYNTLSSFMKEEITRSQDDYADPLVIADEHQELLDAIASKNSIKAAEACREHINNIKRRLNV